MHFKPNPTAGEFFALDNAVNCPVLPVYSRICMKSNFKNSPVCPVKLVQWVYQPPCGHVFFCIADCASSRRVLVNLYWKFKGIACTDKTQMLGGFLKSYVEAQTTTRKTAGNAEG